MTNFKIIFYGTPDFAIPAISILIKNGFDVCAVVTVEDRKAGRGLKVQESAIKKFAKKNNISVLQPSNLKDESFLDEINNFNADLQVVVAFRKLPKVVWEMPAKGTINLHASLLPHYRGAAPINWAIINGERKTGVTTFFINQNIDTGDIIMQDEVSITDVETAESLHDKLSDVGAKLLLKTVNAIMNGENPRLQQKEETIIKKAPKINKEDCRINWSKNIDELYNFIRGLSPYPCAWTTFDKKIYKIYSVTKEPVNHNDKAGTIESNYKTFLKIKVKGGNIVLKEIQMQGRKRMAVEDFLRGANIDKDSCFV
ncbi:MAG: methionyl-tRNA formyltransferase [Bacteroidota bacterium]|nr:methionyl-tRNA formyltransferase [Bacteroidota bacterium]